MAVKPKAGASKKKAGKPAIPKEQKEQSERFIETARELGVDESGKKFERAFNKVLRTRARSQS